MYGITSAPRSFWLDAKAKLETEAFERQQENRETRVQQKLPELQSQLLLEGQEVLITGQEAGPCNCVELSSRSQR